MGHSAPTKNHTSLWSAYSLVSGSGTITSDVVDLTQGYGACVTITMIGGVGDTDEPLLDFYVSPDSSNWYRFKGRIHGFGQYIGDTLTYGRAWSSFSQNYSIDIPMGIPYFKIVMTAHDWGAAWSITADVSEVQCN